MIKFHIVAFFATSVNAQVNAPSESKTVQIKYTPVSPQNNVRMEINTAQDTVKLFYWIYKEIDGVKTNAQRKHDCLLPWSFNQKYSDTYILFNAWIKQKYNIL